MTQQNANLHYDRLPYFTCVHYMHSSTHINTQIRWAQQCIHPMYTCIHSVLRAYIHHNTLHYITLHSIASYHNTSYYITMHCMLHPYTYAYINYIILPYSAFGYINTQPHTYVDVYANTCIQCMHTAMSTWACTCMCYMHTHYTLTYICSYIRSLRSQINTHIHRCRHADIHYMNACMHACMRTCVPVTIHTYMHAYINDMT